MADPVELRGPLIPFSVNPDTLEVTILQQTSGLAEMLLAEGRPVIDKRNNSALIEALKKYDERRKRSVGCESATRSLH